MMKKYEKFANFIANVSFFVSCVAITCMAFLGFVDVVLRLVFKNPIVGATEMVLVLFLCVPAAMPKVALKNDFTKVPILIEHFPRNVRRVINFITVGVTCVFSFVVSWRFLLAGIYSKQIGITYSLANIPEWPFQFVFVLSFAALGFVLPVVMYKEWKYDTTEEQDV